jgi:hypothetical protein
LPMEHLTRAVRAGVRPLAKLPSRLPVFAGVYVMSRPVEPVPRSAQLVPVRYRRAVDEADTVRGW